MTIGRPHNNIGFLRRRVPDWQELRETYPRVTACLALTIALLLLTDLCLLYQRIELGREQELLRASIARAEIQQAGALAAARHDIGATGDLLARRAMLRDRELHLAVDRGRGIMSLQREAALLREMPVRLNLAAPPGSRSGAEDPARPRGSGVVLRVVDGSYPWEVPAAAFSRLGEPVPADRTVPGALGRLAIILDQGAVIYSLPPTGPLRERGYLPPGAIRAEAADLEAIRADLHPGMKVYFYGHESTGD